MPRINIATVREIPEWFQSRRCNHLAQVEVFTHITNFLIEMSSDDEIWVNDCVAKPPIISLNGMQER